MTDLTTTRLGQINNTGDALALFLKVFGGEVLTQFNTECKFKDKHRVRMISSGKSAQFPAIGKASGGYHVPGTTMSGGTIPSNERIITVDDLLVSHVSIASIDDAMNHYDVRKEYGVQLADFLAQQYDQNIARVGVLAARTAGAAALPGGSRITAATMKTDSDVLAASIFGAAQTLDEKNVPEKNRNVFLKPAQYYSAAQNTNLINKDWGGQGSLAKGTFESLADITVIKTNNLASANDTANTDINAKYRADFSAVAGLVMGASAVGTVQLLNMAVESEWMIREQGWFTVAKYLLGHGVLRADEAVELATV